MAKHRRISVLVSGPLCSAIGGIQTYCRDYLRSSLPSEFNITFCRAILIESVFTTKHILRFALRCVNSLSITLVWVAMLLVKRPDIVHVHTSSYTGFYVKSTLVLLGSVFGTKTILHIHGAEFKKFYEATYRPLRWLMRHLIGVNSVVIVLSKGWREFFKSVGVPDGRIVVMTNSVFLPEIPEDKRDSGKVTVLFMSLFEKRKGIHELADVIEQHRELLGKCRFVLAGPKTCEWDAVAERMRRPNLFEAVEMPGALVGESKERALRNADIYVLQSYAEGMPIGLLEAMSYGLACITTPVGGIPDVVQSGQNGLLIEPGNVDALAKALEQLVNNLQLRQRLGSAARATVEREYNWTKRAKEIKQLYLTLVQEESVRIAT